MLALETIKSAARLHGDEIGPETMEASIHIIKEARAAIKIGEKVPARTVSIATMEPPLSRVLRRKGHDLS